MNDDGGDGKQRKRMMINDNDEKRKRMMTMVMKLKVIIITLYCNLLNNILTTFSLFSLNKILLNIYICLRSGCSMSIH